jgi:hypothetical protein
MLGLRRNTVSVRLSRIDRAQRAQYKQAGNASPAESSHRSGD